MCEVIVRRSPLLPPRLESCHVTPCPCTTSPRVWLSFPLPCLRSSPNIPGFLLIHHIYSCTQEGYNAIHESEKTNIRMSVKCILLDKYVPRKQTDLPQKNHTES